MSQEPTGCQALSVHHGQCPQGPVRLIFLSSFTIWRVEGQRSKGVLPRSRGQGVAKPRSGLTVHPCARHRGALPILNNNVSLNGLKPTWESDHKASSCLCASSSWTQAKLKGMKGFASLTPDLLLRSGFPTSIPSAYSLCSSLAPPHPAQPKLGLYPDPTLGLLLLWAV